jgi:hypothetical protein
VVFKGSAKSDSKVAVTTSAGRLDFIQAQHIRTDDTLFFHKTHIFQSKEVEIVAMSEPALRYSVIKVYKGKSRGFHAGPILKSSVSTIKTDCEAYSAQNCSFWEENIR